MKRKEEAIQRQQEEAQHRVLAEQGHWTLAQHSTLSPRYYYYYYYYYCISLMMSYRFRVEYDSSLGNTGVSVGSARQSFGHFNQETERLNEEERNKRQKAASVSRSTQTNRLPSSMIKPTTNQSPTSTLAPQKRIRE